jgi:hypothetical protein
MSGKSVAAPVAERACRGKSRAKYASKRAIFLSQTLLPDEFAIDEAVQDGKSQRSRRHSGRSANIAILEQPE